MGRKHKHKNNDTECNVNEEFMGELAEGVFTELGKRRLLARKPDGEIAFEWNLAGTIIGGIIVTVFLFPVTLAFIIWSFTQKVQFEVIMEITDDEADMIDTFETQNTIIGTTDGEATKLMQA